MHPINEKLPQVAKPQLYPLSNLLGAWEAEAIAAHEARKNGTPRGALTGIASLDHELNGALAPGVHYINGAPGTGKTAFALQAAARCQCPALFVTCEMGPLELLRRLTANITGTFLGRLKSGEFRPTDSMALAREAVQAAPQLALLDATQAWPDLEFIRTAALTTRRDAKHLLIVIDSLHSWSMGRVEGATEYEKLNWATSALGTVAQSLQCPVLAISERNRETMKEGGQSSGAGTRKIEYGAETVISLNRADAREDGAGNVMVSARFDKNRHGAQGRKVDLLFNGAMQRFTEVK